MRVLVLFLFCIVILFSPHRAEAAWDTFPVGQCTFYAAEMRPDLIGSVQGNAGVWAYQARNAGFRVGSIPRVGSVAVFQPYTYQADGYGHVAYVLRVYGYWFLVSEENFPLLGVVTYRWVRNDGGIDFIY